ncbi:MAG: hypothetical protein AB7P76_06365 [Candidatus Melainabacteria bacterium]
MQSPILQASTTAAQSACFGINHPVEILEEDEESPLAFQWQANVKDPVRQAHVCWQVDSLFEMMGVYDPDPALRQICIDQINAGVSTQSVIDQLMDCMVTGQTACPPASSRKPADWRQSA